MYHYLLIPRGKFIKKIFLYLFPALLLVQTHEVYAYFYSIQTGAYTPSAIGYAKRHLNELSGILHEDERDYLRIEQGSKYFFVKVGKFDSYSAAESLLGKIKLIVPDAFILKEESFVSAQFVKLDMEPAAALGRETSTSKNEKDATTSTVREKYYTLQLKNFLKIEEAKIELNKLAGKLDKSDRENLRIEKSGKYFSLRIGKFDTHRLAVSFLTKLKDAIPYAVVLKINNGEEHIISRYLQTREFPDASITKETEYAIINTAKNKAEETKQKTELLLKNVSAQYYNGDYGKAAELLRKGIEQWPDNPDLYAWYGAALLNMKNPENALEQYRKAADMSPDVPDYHTGVGVSLIYLYMDRAKESISAFKKALELDSQNVNALEGLGFVYASIGRKDLANDIYNRLAVLDKDAANRLYLTMTQGINWEEDKAE